MTTMARITTWATIQQLTMSSLNNEFDNVVQTWNRHNNGTAAWDNLTLGTSAIMKIPYQAQLQFTSLSGSLTTTMQYLINNFVINGDTTNGINLAGNVTLGETAGSFGGGSVVTFIKDCAVQPSSNPSLGGILYAVGGALKYRGSGGTVTTIAAS